MFAATRCALLLDLGTSRRVRRETRCGREYAVQPSVTKSVGTRTEGHWYASGARADNSGMTDPHHTLERPIVYETKAELGPRRPRLHVPGIAGVAGAVAALAAATGIAWGGSALWTALDTPAEGAPPASLWFPPPPEVTITPSSGHDATDDRPGSNTPTPTVDDRDGRVTAPPATGTTRGGLLPTDDSGGGGGRGRSPGGSGRG